MPVEINNFNQCSGSSALSFLGGSCSGTPVDFVAEGLGVAAVLRQLTLQNRYSGS
jgi:hypothetical protein